MPITTPSVSDDPRLLRLSPEDNVGVAKQAIEAGETVVIAGRVVTISRRIPTGHKIALVAVASGQRIFKCGAPIGSAQGDIQPGDYVHTHNLKSDYLPTYTLDGSSPYLHGH